MPRVAFVTGGTRGIGAAICKALKAAGYTVAANYAGNDEAAQKFKAETGIAVYKWDVSSFDACAAGVKQVEADLGPVDVLVNNAGITRDGMFHRMTPEQWNAVINTNLGSLFNMSRQVIEGMRERKFGRIINISSINGQKGQIGQANYSAAKAGEIGFTKALAQEGARAGITVNAICPGLHQHRDGAGGAEGGAGEDHPAADSGRPARRAGGDRALRRVSGLRRRRPHHRLDADRQRRPVLRLAARLPALAINHQLSRPQTPAAPIRSRRNGNPARRCIRQDSSRRALRRLPGMDRHDRLRPCAGGEIVAQ